MRYMNHVTGAEVSLETDSRLTAAQKKKAATFVKNDRSISKVLVGMYYLPKGYAEIVYSCGYTLGISPDGRGSS